MALSPETQDEVRSRVDKQLAWYATLFGVPSLIAVLIAAGTIVWFVVFTLPGLVRAEVINQTAIAQGLTQATNDAYRSVGKAEGTAESTRLAAVSALQDVDRIKSRLKEVDTLLATPEGEQAKRLNSVLELLNRPGIVQSLDSVRTAVRCGSVTITNVDGPPWSAVAYDGNRTRSVIRVEFKPAFDKRPHVYAAWSGVDAVASGGKPEPAADYFLYVSHVGNTGFDLHVVRGKDYAFDNNKVTWIAVGVGDVVDINDGSCTPVPK